MKSEQIAGAELRKLRDLIAMKTAEYMQAHHARLLEEVELDYTKQVNYTLADVDKLVLSIIGDRPSLIINYVRWQRSLFVSREIPKKAIQIELEALKHVISELMSPENAALVTGYLDEGLAVLREELEQPGVAMESSGEWRSVAEKYLSFLLEKKREDALSEIIPMINDSATVKEVYSNVLLPVQREIGRLWQLNRISVADEHYATETTRQLMAQLSSRVRKGDGRNGDIISTCLGGELHDLGMRMVNDFFSIEGYRTYYTGANTPAISIVQWLSKDHYDLIAISAALTSHLRMVREAIEKIRAEGYKDIPVLVGGFAFNDDSDLWKIVGADGWAPTAEEAVDIAARLIGSGRP